MRCILSFKSVREYGDERIKIRGECVRCVLGLLRAWLQKDLSVSISVCIE